MEKPVTSGVGHWENRALRLDIRIL